MLVPAVTFWLAACLLVVHGQYAVPDATLIAYKPRGLHVSIPDSEGVQLFAFHGNVNKEMGDREAGELAKDVLRAKNGGWIFEDKRIRLKKGDVINYWMYVQVDGVGYPKDFLTWTVPALVDITATPPTATSNPQPICNDTVTTVNGKKSCRGKLIFEETFDSLQESKWERISQFGGNPAYPFVTYVKNESRSFVANGNLNIVPLVLPEEAFTSGTVTIEDCTGLAGTDECTREAHGGVYLPPIHSAQIRTKQSFNFRYGKVEIRAKVPFGDWIYPEIQLKPSNHFYGSEPLTSGQINMVLVRGNRDLKLSGEDIGNRILESSCEMGYNSSMHRETVKRTGTGFWGDVFHVYTMIWSPDEIVFTVDGNPVGKVTPPAGGFRSKPQFAQSTDIPWTRGSKMAPFDQEFYISLGIGVGGFREFPNNSITVNNHAKPWRNWNPQAISRFWIDRQAWLPTWQPNILEVDYVKVWAL